MNKKRIVIFLALFAILGIGNMGLLTLLPITGQNGGTQAPLGTSPSTANAGDLVRNPYFEGAWQNDWVGSVVGTDGIDKQQTVHAYAVHHDYNFPWTCAHDVDEDYTSTATSRDDGSASFVQGVALTKVGSGTSSFLRYQAHLFSSGYAHAQAGDSSEVCSDSEASVSWSLDDTVTYTRRITQNLNNFGETNPLTYAVFSGKYKMLSTMSASDVWHAKVTFKLQAPNGDTVQTAMNYFESQALNGVELSFNQDVLAFMQSHGVGVYKYIIEFEFSMHHADARSDSDSANDGATAVTPSITYDDYVSLDFYGARLVYTTTLSPPELSLISPSPDTDGQVVLSWSQVTNAQQYLIYRNNTAVITGRIDQTLLHTVLSGDITTWTDPSAPRGENWYVIVAYDTSNYSPISECRYVEVILKPPAIADLVVPATDDDGEFVISWGAKEQATGYKIYMETSPIGSLDGKTAIASTASLSYTVGPVDEGTYYFAVVGTNIAGDGPLSNTDSIVVTIVTPPAAPVWVSSVSTVYQNHVDLDWNPCSGAKNYTVYRNGSFLINTRLTEFTDYNLNDTHEYRYTVTAWNYRGESASNPAYVVTCNIPNVFDKFAAWLATLDPMIYNILDKAMPAIFNYIGGTDVWAYLNGHANYAKIDYTLGLGDYTITAGVKLKLDLQMELFLNPADIRFVIIPKTMTTFSLADMNLGGAFSDIAGTFAMLQKFGVTVTPSLYVAGKIDFKVILATSDVVINEIAIEFKPKVVTTVNVLKLILSVCAPEAEPVVSTIAKLIDKFTGYDIYDIITAELTITLDVIVRYFPTAGKVVLDIVLDVKLDAIRINFAQPRKDDHYEMVAGIVGQAGVHWETGSDLTWCGQLYFFLTFDFQDVEISLVRNILQQAVDWTGLSYDQPNLYYLVGPESACAPISLTGPSPASGPDSDNDYLDDEVDPAPTLPDGDGDGLWDYLELDIGSDPLVVDTDNDGLTDSEEYDLGTNASQVDTDSDGLVDVVEVGLGTDPCSEDTDGDLLTDNDELTAGTNPLVADTDADGFSDGWEVHWYNTDPLLPESVPADADNDDLPNVDEMYLFQTNPNDADNLDSDGDGLSNAAENIFFGSNPYLADSDADGLNDNIEIDNGIYYMDPDSDSDRLLDGEEFLSYHTDPLKQDTDGDGYTDYLEIVLGSDPLNYYNTPKEFKIEDYATVYAFIIGAAVAVGAIFGVWAFQRYFGNPLRGLKLRGAASNAMNRASRRIRGKSIAPKPLPEGMQGPAEKEPSPMELKAKSRFHKKSKKAKGFWGNIQS